MRRRQLSNDELDKVIRLRQTGTSWLKIQHETGIHRQTTKRAYERWERSKSLDELKEARKAVAAEDFRKHKDCLIEVAQALRSAFLSLPAPGLVPAETSADFIDNILRRNLVGQYGVYGHAGSRGDYAQDLCYHQNKVLFDSLMTHTSEQGCGNALKEWCQGWDTCVSILNSLREEARKQIKGFFSQEANLLSGIKKENMNKDVIQEMQRAVVSEIWRAITEGKLDPEHSKQALFKTGKIHDGPIGLAPSWDIGATWILLFTDDKLAQKALDICNLTGSNLLIKEKESIHSLVNTISQMRRESKVLSEALNPLRLGAIILHTRCDLCPA